MKTASTIPSRLLLLPAALLSAALVACSPSPAPQAAAPVMAASAPDPAPVAAVVAPPPPSAPVAVVPEAPALEPTVSKPPVKTAVKAPKKHTAEVVAAPVPVNAAPAEKVAQQPPPAPPPKPVCAVCGTVEAATPVEVKGESKGVGAVGGVLLGGVLGHQVGGGRGKDLATVIGAVGGGLAGNEVEKHYKSTTRYQLQIRMDDGSTRTVMHDTQMMVGQKVTVENGQVTPAQ